MHAYAACMHTHTYGFCTHALCMHMHTLAQKLKFTFYLFNLFFLSLSLCLFVLFCLLYFIPFVLIRVLGCFSVMNMHMNMIMH